MIYFTGEKEQDDLLLYSPQFFYDTNCRVRHLGLYIDRQHSFEHYLEILWEIFVLIRINTVLSTLFSLMVLYVTLNFLLFRGILEPLLTQQNRKYTKKLRSPLPQYISFSLFSTFTRISLRTCRRQTLGGTTWMNCLHIYICVMHIIYCVYIYYIYTCSKQSTFVTLLVTYQSVYSTFPAVTVPLLDARFL